MQNVSFRGLLTIQNKNKPVVLNTEQMVSANGNKEDSNVEIRMSNGDKVNVGCKFADIEKALIKANRDGYYSFTPPIDSVKPRQIGNIEPRNGNNVKTKAANNIEEDKKKTPADTDNVFELIPKDIAIMYRGKEGLCPNSYESINAKLRSGQNLNQTETLVANATDEAFDNIKGLEKDETFYRAIWRQSLDEDILNSSIGDIIVPDGGYPQIALNKGSLEKYIRNDYAIFEIRCPKGSKVCKVPGKLTGSGYPEAMFPRGAKFRIIDKEDNATHIHRHPSWNDKSMEEEKMNVTKFILEYIED